MIRKLNPAAQGELSALSSVEGHQILAGVVVGALVAGALTFLIFGMVIRTLDYPDGGTLLGIATLIGVLHGAVTGPIVALVFRKKTARAYGL